MTNSTLKLNYTSVIFVNPAVKIDETWLSALLEKKKKEFSYRSCCVPRRRSPVVHYWAPVVQHAQNMLVYSLRVLQGSEATRYWCAGILKIFIANFSKDFGSERILKIRWELTNLSIEYGISHFWDTVYIIASSADICKLILYS